jgi:hypothetical protein
MRSSSDIARWISSTQALFLGTVHLLHEELLEPPRALACPGVDRKRLAAPAGDLVRILVADRALELERDLDALLATPHLVERPLDLP